MNCALAIIQEHTSRETLTCSVVDGVDVLLGTEVLDTAPAVPEGAMVRAIYPNIP